MYQTLSLLTVKDHANLKVTPSQSLDFARQVSFAPMAISEIVMMAKKLPVLISNSDDQEFMCLMALSGQDNIFVHQPKLTQHLPAYLQTYPFAMVNAKQEGQEKTVRAVAIDIGSDWVSESGEQAIFENQQLSPYANRAVSKLKRFEQERQAAKQLIQALNERELLEKRSIDIQVGEVKKRVLSDFYIVNRQKLYNLPAELLKDWLTKGWLRIIENHIDSVENISQLLANPAPKETLH